MQWLRDEYVAHYSVSRPVSIVINQLPAANDNTLHDEKACNGCLEKGEDVCQHNPVNLVLNNAKPIDKVEVELFFAQFDRPVKASITKRCDIMLCDGKDKLVFCEMTCRDAKYVSDKRAEAYSQIKSVIDKFCTVPNIKQRFDTFNQRVGLFALREKCTSENPDQAEDAMIMMIPQYDAGPNLSTNMGNGFKFITVKYPEVYIW